MNKLILTAITAMAFVGSVAMAQGAGTPPPTETPKTTAPEKKGKKKKHSKKPAAKVEATKAN